MNWGQFKDPACYLCVIALLHKGLQVRIIYFGGKHLEKTQLSALPFVAI